jgi:hypothetical protein
MNNDKEIVVELIVGSIHGTVTHYYHFFYAVFIPLILKYIEYSKKYDKITFIVNDNLGPMVRILMELPIDIKFSNYISEKFKNKIKKEYLVTLNIHPSKKQKDKAWINKKWADFFTYDKYKKINKFMNDQIHKHDLILKPFTKFDIVVIERKKDIRYLTQKNPINNKSNILEELVKVSGTDRRSIINHKEFFNSLKKYFKKFKIINISTEYLPIFDQYILFNNAKIVIAQHGAVLSNITFMKEKSHVIEIMTKKMLDEGENWFKPNAEICKVNHIQYMVNDFFVKINIEDFINFMNDKKILDLL